MSYSWDMFGYIKLQWYIQIGNNIAKSKLFLKEESHYANAKFYMEWEEHHYTGLFMFEFEIKGNVESDNTSIIVPPHQLIKGKSKFTCSGFFNSKHH